MGNVGTFLCMASAVCVPVILADAQISMYERIAWASLISFVGGAASVLRTHAVVTVYDVLRVAGNTAVLGASISLIGTYWSKDDTNACLLIVGICGAMSLAGLQSIEWLVGLTKKTIESSVDRFIKK